MVLIYATVTDLAEPPWSVTDPPVTVESDLWRASLLVGAATRTAIYATDETGMPTDPDIIAALRDATCSQVVTWITLGVDASAAGADAATSSGRVSASKSIGGASISFVGVESAMERRAATATSLTAEAVSILTLAGLIGGSDIRVTG